MIGCCRWRCCYACGGSHRSSKQTGQKLMRLLTISQSPSLLVDQIVSPCHAYTSRFGVSFRWHLLYKELAICLLRAYVSIVIAPNLSWLHRLIADTYSSDINLLKSIWVWKPWMSLFFGCWALQNPTTSVISGTKRGKLHQSQNRTFEHHNKEDIFAFWSGSVIISFFHPRPHCEVMLPSSGWQSSVPSIAPKTPWQWHLLPYNSIWYIIPIIAPTWTSYLFMNLVEALAWIKARKRRCILPF